MTQAISRLGVGQGVMTQNGPVLPFDTPSGFVQQAYTFTFKLIDGVTGQFKRFLTPVANSIPQLSHDSTRTIKRQISLQLAVADTTAIDTIRDRVLISMVVGSTTYPLGKYTFSTNQRSLSTGGRQSAPTLMDEELILDENTTSAFPPSNLVQRTATIQKNLSSFGTIVDRPVNANNLAHILLSLYPNLTGIIEQSPFYTTATWSFGTSGLQILSDIATLGDFFPPWMANDGLLHMIRTFDPAQVVPDFDWDAYPHVYADTITEEDDLLSAPNRFIVVSNSASTQDATSSNPDSSTIPPQATNLAVIGTYDVPVNAPHSIQNRGFVVSQVDNIQLDAQDQAIAVARTIGIQSTIYQRTSLTTFPDPRHDSYNVIRWQGRNWLELSWAMDLVAGGNMTHTLRRTYT